MKTEAILSTTHLDRQGERIAREALEQMASNVNGEYAVALTVEHDCTLPPLGKSLTARVEKRPDGEYQLVGSFEEFSRSLVVRLPNGELAHKHYSEQNTKPFLLSDRSAPEVTEVRVDHQNFEGASSLQAFYDELDPERSVVQGRLFRKSLIPDPLVVIAAAKAVTTYFFVKQADRLASPTLDSVGKDVAKFYAWVRCTAFSAAKHCFPKHRPVIYVIEFAGRPCIEFVACTRDPHTLLSAVRESVLLTKVEEALEIAATLEVLLVQFLLDRNGDWKFNYAHTSDGGVIGTPASFRRRAQKIEVTRKTGEKIKAMLRHVNSQDLDMDSAVLAAAPTRRQAALPLVQLGKAISIAPHLTHGEKAPRMGKRNRRR